MHPHLAEVMPEARLEECARGRVEWLARRAQDFVHDGGHLCLFENAVSLALERHFLLCTLRALPARCVCPTGTLVLQQAALDLGETSRVRTRNLLLRCGEARHRVLLGEFHFHVGECAGRAFRFCDLHVLEVGGRSPLAGLRLLGRFTHRRLVRKTSTFPQVKSAVERLKVVATAPSAADTLHRTGAISLLEVPFRLEEFLFSEKRAGSPTAFAQNDIGLHHPLLIELDVHVVTRLLLPRRADVAEVFPFDVFAGTHLDFDQTLLGNILGRLLKSNNTPARRRRRGLLGRFKRGLHVPVRRLIALYHSGAGHLRGDCSTCGHSYGRGRWLNIPHKTGYRPAGRDHAGRRIWRQRRRGLNVWRESSDSGLGGNWDGWLRRSHLSFDRSDSTSRSAYHLAGYLLLLEH